MTPSYFLIFVMIYLVKIYSPALIKWADGDSFIVLGRVADDLFRGYEGFVSIFIYADIKDRINMIKLFSSDTILVEEKDNNVKATYDFLKLKEKEFNRIIKKGGYFFFKYEYTSTSQTYSNISSIKYTLAAADNPSNVANYIMYEDTNNQ